MWSHSINSSGYGLRDAVLIVPGIVNAQFGLNEKSTNFCLRAIISLTVLSLYVRDYRGLSKVRYACPNFDNILNIETKRQMQIYPELDRSPTASNKLGHPRLPSASIGFTMQKWVYAICPNTYRFYRNLQRNMKTETRLFCCRKHASHQATDFKLQCPKVRPTSSRQIVVSLNNALRIS